MQRLLDLVADVIQVALAGPLQQQFVTGQYFVGEAEFQGATAVPVLARGDLLEVQLRAVATDGRLEEGMNVFEFFLELRTVLVGVLAEHRYGALVFAGRNLLEIDAVTVEQAIEVG